MLRLASRTDPAWTAHALAHLDEILLDHAHLEKKAAGAALTLLFQYPDQVACRPRRSLRSRRSAWRGICAAASASPTRSSA